MPLRFNKNKRYTQNGIKFGEGVWEDSNDKKRSFYPPGFGYEVDRKTKTVVQLNSDGTKTKIPYEEWAEKQLSQNQLGLIKNDRKYAIPVVKDKMMTISIDKDSPTSKTRGITFSENLLDSIALNAKKAGLPFSTAIGIVAQESMFGNSKGRQPGMTPLYSHGFTFINENDNPLKQEAKKYNYEGFYSPIMLTSDWKQAQELPFFDYFHDEQGFPVNNKYSKEQIDKDINSSRKKENNYRVEDVSPLYHSFRLYAEDPYKYNHNDSGYPKEVKARSVELSKYSPEIKEYMKDNNLKANGGQLNIAKSWDDLSLEEQSQIMRTAIQNGIYNLNDIKTKYNEFAGGGELEEWKALNNIDYEVIPDTSFTIDKTGTGTIEYFNSKYPQGTTYPNGYHKAHPMPGKDVILYNPKYNDYQDIRLDALHIMPKDATYDALNSLYRDAAKDSDVAYNAELRYKEDLNNYGKENIDSYQDYFNNEADGLLRNMFIEGTPEYITSRRYYPNKAQLKEWNSHLMPYINNIQFYLETGVRPSNILPEVIITPNKKALGGPTDEETENSELPPRRVMPRHPKNREKNPAAYDNYMKWREEMAIRDQYFKKQQQINKTDNNKELDRINSLVGALNESTNTPIFNGEEIKEAAEKQREEKLKKWEDYKLGLEATASAAELLSAGYGIIRGLTHLGKKGAQYALLSKNPLFNTTPANYRKWKNIAETWDKPQIFMNTLGGLADGYQWITANNSYDAWENGIETGGNVAGVIGGTNWFRNQPFFGRYGDRIDNTLDIMGYGSAAWDVVKNLPPLSTVIDKSKSGEPTTKNSSNKKSLGGLLVEF